MGHMLVDKQGNFGSIDDDPAAAMRYTECRLAPFTAASLLEDLGKETVEFAPNFDASEVSSRRLVDRLGVDSPRLPGTPFAPDSKGSWQQSACLFPLFSTASTGTAGGAARAARPGADAAGQRLSGDCSGPRHQHPPAQPQGGCQGTQGERISSEALPEEGGRGSLCCCCCHAPLDPPIACQGPTGT